MTTSTSAIAPVREARGTVVIRPRIAYFWWLDAHRATTAPAGAAAKAPRRA